MDTTKFSTPAVFVSIALFVVWLEANGRLSLAAKAAGSKYSIAGT
jgi:hypothetical protein